PNTSLQTSNSHQSPLTDHNALPSPLRPPPPHRWHLRRPSPGPGPRPRRHRPLSATRHRNLRRPRFRPRPPSPNARQPHRPRRRRPLHPLRDHQGVGAAARHRPGDPLFRTLPRLLVPQRQPLRLEVHQGRVRSRAGGGEPVWRAVFDAVWRGCDYREGYQGSLSVVDVFWRQGLDAWGSQDCAA
ncbi:hypothetical protein EDC01DRAFT_756805, partial [Geopyxis carbonaria]